MTWPIIWFVQFMAFIGSYFFNPEVRDLKQQAFERGYMVQCIGKTGYYWECE